MEALCSPDMTTISHFDFDFSYLLEKGQPSCAKQVLRRLVSLNGWSLEGCSFAGKHVGHYVRKNILEIGMGRCE